MRRVIMGDDKNGVRDANGKGRMGDKKEKTVCYICATPTLYTLVYIIKFVYSERNTVKSRFANISDV